MGSSVRRSAVSESDKGKGSVSPVTERLTPNQLEHLLAADDGEPELPELLAFLALLARSPAGLAEAARAANALGLAADFGRASDAATGTTPQPSAAVIERVVGRAVAAYDHSALRPGVADALADGPPSAAAEASPATGGRPGGAKLRRSRLAELVRRPKWRAAGLAAGVVVVASVIAVGRWQAARRGRAAAEDALRNVEPASGQLSLSGAAQYRAAVDVYVHSNLKKFVDRRGGVGLVAIAPDGRSVVTAEPTGELELWDMWAVVRVCTLPGRHSGTPPVRVVGFSPDGRTLVVGGTDGVIRLVDTSTGREIQTLPPHVGRLAFSPDGGDRPATRVGGPSRSETRPVAPPDGQGAGGDQGIVPWGPPGDRPPRATGGAAVPITAVAQSPDGRKVLSVAADGGVRLWDLSGGRVVGSLRSDPGVAVSFSPDGRALVTNPADGKVTVLDIGPGPAPGPSPRTAPTTLPAGPAARDAAGDPAAGLSLPAAATTRPALPGDRRPVE